MARGRGEMWEETCRAALMYGFIRDLSLGYEIILGVASDIVVKDGDDARNLISVV